MMVHRHIASLLLICFSAYLGHNLVPHHHHREVILNPLATDCPVEHGDRHCCHQDGEAEYPHSAPHPAHCHAFNDVVFEKHHPQLIKPASRFTLVLAVPHADLVPDSPAHNEFYKYYGLKFLPRAIERCGSRDLRGPPQIA